MLTQELQKSLGRSSMFKSLNVLYKNKDQLGMSLLVLLSLKHKSWTGLRWLGTVKAHGSDVFMHFATSRVMSVGTDWYFIRILVFVVLRWLQLWWIYSCLSFWAHWNFDVWCLDLEKYNYSEATFLVNETISTGKQVLPIVGMRDLSGLS